MADVEKTQETIEIDETKEIKDTKVEEKIEEKPENKPFGFKIPDIISKTIAKIKGDSGKPKSYSALEDDKIESKESDEAEKPETKEVDEQKSKEVESPDSEPSGDEIIEEEIPYHLVQSARELGWSDETIVKIAENDISILEDVYNKSKPELKKEVEKEKPTEIPKVVIEDAVLKKWREDFGDDAVDKVIKPLLDAQNKLNEQVNTLQGNLNQQKVADQQNNLAKLFNQFNSVLDNLSKDYPEFGTYEKMPKKQDGSPLQDSPEFKVRSKIYDTMNMFLRNGYPEDKAIREAIDWYSGKQGEKRAERKLVTELNDQKKKFSPKPTAKKGTKVYHTVDEKKAGIIAEAKKAAGIE